MAEITRKRVGEIVKKVFEILIKNPDGLPAKEVLAKVESSLGLTEFEKQDYPNHPGVRRFEKTARFATIAPVKAGWLIKTKGRWILTPDGEAAYKDHPDPETLAKRAGDLYRQWREIQPETVEDAEPEETAAEIATTTLEEAEELAWAEIEKHLQNLPPYELQKLVSALLKAMGYHISWISPPGPDRGIDIIAYTDPLGAQNPRIKVQVKRHSGAVDAHGLRSFMAVLGEHEVGIFVCTGGFTSNAQMEARTQERRKITLLDLEKLFGLWVLHYGRIEEADKRLLPLKPVHYLAGLE